jgi:hypothetical protein
VEIFCAGRAFLLSGGQVSAPHLWFVLTDADASGKVITVMLRSAKPYTDKTVVLNVGDHPWIRHESNIDYGTARPVPKTKLIDANNGSRLVIQADMSKELLQKVRDGLLKSSHTIHAVRDECKARFEEPETEP